MDNLLSSYTTIFPLSIKSLLSLCVIVPLWWVSGYVRNLRMKHERLGPRRKTPPMHNASELSARSHTSSTTDDSESEEEGNILETIATLFRANDANDENDDIEASVLPLENSCVARVLPADRVDYQQQKPQQAEITSLLKQKFVSTSSSQGATCVPNRVGSNVAYFDFQDSTSVPEQELRVTLDVDVTAQVYPDSPRYRIQMHLNRSAKEAASRTLERLQISLNRKLLRQERLDKTTFTPPKNCFPESSRKTQNHSPASVWTKQDEGEEDEASEDGYSVLRVEGSMTSSDLWEKLSEETPDCHLQIKIEGDHRDFVNELTIPVEACPPTILSVHTFIDFGASVFVGIPLVVEVETLHASELTAVWFANEEVVSRGGLVYTPREEHVGKQISVLLRPARSNHNGSGCEEAYTFEHRVETLPDLPLISPLREEWKNRNASEGRLRVLTYNILADMYVSREVDQLVMYGHCPTECLNKRVRMPLLLYEMLVFKPDIICLQEVDLSVFSSLFRPALESQGYQGFFSNKASSQLEGCALFWSLDCFERVEKFRMRTYCIRELFQDCTDREDEASRSIHGIVQLLDSHKELSRVVRAKVGQVLQAAELRLKSKGGADSKPDRIVVGNTHLFYHPMADHIRALQACLVCHQLEGFRRENWPSPCPLVFCGDFNSNPLSGAVRLLLDGSLEPDHVDAWKYLHEYEWEMGDEEYLLEHGYIGNEVDSGDPAYEEEAFEDALEHIPEIDTHYTEKIKPPRLSLPRSFPELGLGYEETPVFTNYAVDFSETLDYIFASKPSEKEKYGFVSAKSAPMPSIDFMKEYDAMPNQNMPSDHVSLLCDLDWVCLDG